MAAAAEQPTPKAPAWSDLWGRNGERWSPSSRLPDFSFAGYGCGERSIPAVKPGVSVKQFGATGDGATDDTQAFLDALAKVKDGAIEVPPGRYKITRILEITRSHVVLRGAGPDKSILVCPVPLNDIKPNWGATTEGRKTSNYSWSGGIVLFKGNVRGPVLASLTTEARRGDTVVTVSSTKALKPGMRVQVFQQDTADLSLTKHLYSDDPGDLKKHKGSKAVLACRVVKVHGNKVQIDRPLRCDVKPAWQPELRSFDPTVVESGVEGLGFEFPNVPYRGHFTELGFNAVAMQGVADCWARNLRIINSDSGIYLNGFFCTATHIMLESARKPDGGGNTGHHGVSFSGHDNLLTDFEFKTRFIHDLTVDAGGSGNVSMNGKAVDLCLDHHKRTCYENLFTQIDAGAGGRLWAHGGGAALGKPCAARGTFWNITAKRSLNPAPIAFGPPSMNFVALQGQAGNQKMPGKIWIEAADPAAIQPSNIYQAQRRRRTGR